MHLKRRDHFAEVSKMIEFDRFRREAEQMANLKSEEYKTFESIKHIRDDGTEFWYARELVPTLEYSKWENFSKVIDRAMLACKNSGYSVEECFPEVRKTSAMPRGGTKPLIDYELTRYACYLIVQKPNKSIQAVEREELRKLRKSGKQLMLDE
jgi:hypothetical protein